MSALEALMASIRSAEFPRQATLLTDPLLSSDRRLFEAQESVYFDYKLNFPFSFSDEYFAGIARLIAGLYNSFGGLIIFGVHDEKRTGGHNKVRVRIERLNTRLREIFDEPIECVHTHISSGPAGDVDLILVPKRPSGTAPVVLQIQVAKYRPGTLWFRRAHEVLEATSRDIPFLFGPRLEADEGERGHDHNISGALPPNPATIKSFVGRVRVLKELYSWVVRDDEPRKFLYGRGGSGKSTLAFEFARILQRYGSTIPIFGGHRFDCILYLSAKERRLNTFTGQQEEFQGNDFHNFRGLCEAVLSLSDYNDAWNLLLSPSSPNITENPRFRKLRGIVAAKHQPPKVAEARDDFEYCLGMKYENSDLMRVWAELEKGTGYGFSNLIRICDAVIDGATYSPYVKAEFVSRKASAHFDLSP